MSSRLATLIELDGAYGAKDLYDMLEILAVDSYNDRVRNQGK